MRKLPEVTLLNSKMVREILKILNAEGYISDFKESECKRTVSINLKYYKDKPVIRKIKRISTCSKRVYTGSDFPRLQNDFGMFILFTNRGVKTSHEARALNIGGELVLEVF